MHPISSSQKLSCWSRNILGFHLHKCLAGNVNVTMLCVFQAMVDVDETFSMSPRGEVAHHQKKLSISHVR